MRSLSMGLLAGAALLLAGCVVVPAHRAYGPGPGYGGGYGGDYGAVIDAPPPAPYYEAQPVMPFPGALWIGGYWGWAGGRHNWVPGYWERPRPGYRYEPHRWEPHSGGGGRWHLRLGGWVRL